MKKPSPNKPPQRAKSLRHLAEGVERTKRVIARWPDYVGDVNTGVAMSAVTAHLQQAQISLRAAADALDMLPEDYPPRRIPAQSLIQPGAVVTVRDAYRAEYENLMPGVPLDRLEVVAVNDHRLSFKTADGIVSTAPKKHVKAVEA